MEKFSIKLTIVSLNTPFLKSFESLKCLETFKKRPSLIHDRELTALYYEIGWGLGFRAGCVTMWVVVPP